MLCLHAVIDQHALTSIVLQVTAATRCPRAIMEYYRDAFYLLELQACMIVNLIIISGRSGLLNVRNV